MGRLRLSPAQPIPSGHAYNPNNVCNASAPRSRTLKSGPALSAENAQSINHRASISLRYPCVKKKRSTRFVLPAVLYATVRDGL